MTALIKQLLSQGQSLQAIGATHGSEFVVCERTFYNYIDKGALGLANLELPKKVKYAPRKSRKDSLFKQNLTGRTYADWQALSPENKLLTVQMDTVEGPRSNTQCILTFHFVRLFSSFTFF